MGVTIAAHDLDLKIRQTRKFIEQGHRVKLCIMVRLLPAAACLGTRLHAAASLHASAMLRLLVTCLLFEAMKKLSAARARLACAALLMLQLHCFAVPAYGRHVQDGSPVP